MTSRGSTLTAFNRLHAPGVERPPRADIEEIRKSSAVWGWIGKLDGVNAGTTGACEDEESSRLSKRVTEVDLSKPLHNPQQISSWIAFLYNIWFSSFLSYVHSLS